MRLFIILFNHLIHAYVLLEDCKCWNNKWEVYHEWSSHCKMCFSNICMKMLNVEKVERTPPETAVCADVSSLGPHFSMLLSLFSILFLKWQNKQLVFFVPNVTMLNFCWEKGKVTFFFSFTRLPSLQFFSHHLAVVHKQERRHFFFSSSSSQENSKQHFFLITSKRETTLALAVVADLDLEVKHPVDNYLIIKSDFFFPINFYYMIIIEMYLHLLVKW